MSMDVDMGFVGFVELLDLTRWSFQLSRCWTSGIRYRPLVSRTPTNIGFPLHVISTSCSLCTVTPSDVKIEMLPSSLIAPTLNSESLNFSNVSPVLAFDDSPWKGRLTLYLPSLTLPSATWTRLSDSLMIDRPASLHIASDG